MNAYTKKKLVDQVAVESVELQSEVGVKSKAELIEAQQEHVPGSPPDLGYGNKRILKTKYGRIMGVFCTDYTKKKRSGLSKFHLNLLLHGEYDLDEKK